MKNERRKYMNNSKQDILNNLIKEPFINQRILAAQTGHSLGIVNRSLKELIECTIRQLHEVGITEIYIVVGFMKEQYEYLIDEYGVDLIVAPDYASKNNLHSLKTAADHLSNSYIIPCDIWCEKNPYSRNELYSWYMVSDMYWKRKQRSCGSVWKNWEEIPDTTERSGRKPYTGKTE